MHQKHRRQQVGAAMRETLQARGTAIAGSREM